MGTLDKGRVTAWIGQKWPGRLELYLRYSYRFAISTHELLLLLLNISACRSPIRECKASGKSAMSVPDVSYGVAVYGIIQTALISVLLCLLAVCVA